MAITYDNLQPEYATLGDTLRVVSALASVGELAAQSFCSFAPRCMRFLRSRKAAKVYRFSLVAYLRHVAVCKIRHSTKFCFPLGVDTVGAIFTNRRIS